MATTYNWMQLTNAGITNLFLYGDLNVPTYLVDNDRIRPKLNLTIGVDALSFMATGPGRFANGTQIDLVDEFMSGRLAIPAAVPGEELRIPLKMMLNGPNDKRDRYTLVQSMYRDGFNDHAQRAYVYETQGYVIAKDAVFVIDVNGKRSIENFAILPFNEDFNFESSNWVTQAADYLIQPIIDPSNIGRTVKIVYTEETKNLVPRTTYTQSTFESDKYRFANTFFPFSRFLTAKEELKGVLQELYDSGTTKFTDGAGRAIFYGTNTGDYITESNLFGFPYIQSPLPPGHRLRDQRQNGTAIVAGDGRDMITGGDYSDWLVGGDDGDQLSGGKGKDWLYGQDGNDVLFGGAGDDVIYGGEGEDYLAGNEDNDTLLGGSNNDELSGGTGNDWLLGGDGYDTYYYRTGDGLDTIEDSDKRGQIVFNGTWITGGEYDEDTGDYLSADGNYVYRLENGDLIINDSLVISNFDNGDLDITLTGGDDDGDSDDDDSDDSEDDPSDDGNNNDGQEGPQKHGGSGSEGDEEGPPDGLGSGGGDAGGAAGAPRIDPLALDLDGDGIETTNENNGRSILFDHNADGIKTGSGWLKGDDGWLVRDINENGVIDSGRELFGTDTQLSNGDTAHDGFAALRQFDLNQDGLINSSDAIYSELKVWRDLNQDGISQADELASLADLGITSIGVTPAYITQNFGNGNSQIAQAGFTRIEEDGTESTSLVSSLSLVNNTFYREFTEAITLTQQAKELPSLLGSGRVRNLNGAISLSTDLGNLVKTYTEQTTRQGQVSLLDNFIQKWADTSTYKPLKEQAADLAAQGANVSVTYTLQGMQSGTPEFEQFLTKLGVVERFMGFTFAGAQGQARSAPITASAGNFFVSLSSAQISNINLAYERFKTDIYESLLIKTRDMEYVLALSSGMGSDEGNFNEIENLFTQKIQQNGQVGLTDLIEFISAYGEKRLQALGWNAIEFLSNAINLTDERPILNEELSRWTVHLNGSGQHNFVGTNRKDLLIGTASDDILSGFLGNDVLLGGDGNDQLEGAEGDDLLMGGGGADFISDSNGNDVINGGDGDDYVYDTTGNDIIDGGSGNDNITDYGYGTNVLRGGDGNDIINYSPMANNTIEGGDGNDLIQNLNYGANGSAYSNTFIGGHGNDRIVSNLSTADTYIFNRGDGQDTIRDTDAYMSGKTDSLIFGEGISQTDLTITKSGNNLLIQVADPASPGSTDQITIEDWFNGENMRLESFEFADGSSLTMAQVHAIALTVNGTEGADSLSGSAENDIINGLGGNDVIADSGGNDVINGGSGDDYIYDTTGNDTIDGGSGNDNITDYGYGTNILRGGDGNDTINYSSLASNTIDGGDGDDLIQNINYGNNGSAYSNTFRGGHGNDRIVSNLSTADTYIFNRGDGQDTIRDTDAYMIGKTDRLVFGAGISQSDLTVTKSANNLLIQVTDPANSGLTDQITIEDWFNGENMRLESFEFADGSSLTMAQVHAMALTVNGTEAADSLSGSAENDIINGLGGNDVISDSGGNDVINGGAGDDYIYDTTGNDIIDGGSGNDNITDYGYGTNVLRGGDGNDTINYSSLASNTIDGGDGDDLIQYINYGNNGSAYSNTFIGGHGNDRIVSSLSSADTYIFNRGDGQDTIRDTDAYMIGKTDRLVFGEGISQTDLTITKSGNNLLIQVADPANPGSIDQITIEDWFNGENMRLESFEFADGSSLTMAQVHAMALTVNGTEGADSLSGSAENDIINGLGGNDVIADSGGNDVINGGAGDDYIYDTTGNDIIDGGSGNDNITDYGYGTNVLRGGDGNDTINYSSLANNTIEGGDGNDLIQNINYGNNGSAYSNTFSGGHGNDRIVSNLSTADTYIFNRGDGQDTIRDTDAYMIGKTDRLVFGTGISQTDLTITKSANNLLIQITDPANPGSTDQITIEDWFNGDYMRLESFEFADGSSLTMAQVHAMALTVNGTEGADSLSGSAENDIINGLGGNDVIVDSAGNDVLNGGAGDDYIYDTTGNDIIDGGSGNDTITDHNYGTNILRGGDGNDIINFSPAANNTLEGGNGDDLIQSLNYGSFNGSAYSNTFIGGTGNDRMVSSLSAADTYIFNRGDGQDTIRDTDAYMTGKTDRLVFGAGINQSDLTITKNGNNLLIKVADSVNPSANDQITIEDWFNGENMRLESFEFADGSSLTMAQVHAAALTITGTESADTLQASSDAALVNAKGGDDIVTSSVYASVLYGGSGDDTITCSSARSLLNGGQGNDILNGSSGNDFFIGSLGDDVINANTGSDIIAFNKGDGMDEVYSGSGQDNTLSLGGGISYADLLFQKSGNDLVFVAGVGDQITLKDWYVSTNNHSVQNLQIFTENSTDYAPNSTSQLNNKKIEQFDFTGLVSAFDQARDANPSMTSWSLSSSLLDFYLNSSDTAAIGGDLSYEYAKNGNLSNVSLVPAQAILGSGSFGTASQNLQSTNALQDMSPRLM